MRHPDFSPLRMILRVVLFVVAVIIVLPLVLLAWLWSARRLQAWLAHWFYAIGLYIVGIRLHVQGTPSAARPLMIVANHASYLDVFVIGAQLPVSFTPKREVRSWPLIGFMCVLADCVFVERRPAHMQEARAEMAKRIGAGRVLCLFPEGTTSDGKHLKPFKSGFLSLAQDFTLPVQPASIAYTHIGDEVIADAHRDMVAWIGEATFFKHFLHVLGLPSIEVSVTWHAPLNLKDFADRKALTKAAEQIVNQGVQVSLEAVR